MNQPKINTALGLMSGTSLDGLDLALCRFQTEGEKISFEMLKTTTIDYSPEMKRKLETADKFSGFDLIQFHKEYGKHIGEKVNDFLKGCEKPEIIASHGHTVFHRPELNLTFQLGDGAFIAAQTGISTVSDFRNLDTALGGQGAPLVPIGDELLFPEYDFCLNLGGIANISFRDEKNIRTAFDISPANLLSNLLVKTRGMEYDAEGIIGKNGQINYSLLNELNEIPYYSMRKPKSLGREYINKFFFPIFDTYSISLEDKLRTYYEHIAIQIADTVNRSYSSSPLPHREKRTILVTGGGAFNTFVIERLRTYCLPQIVVPEKKIVCYKEALIFALLGVLKMENRINCLKSVTGAGQDNIGGVIYSM